MAIEEREVITWKNIMRWLNGDIKVPKNSDFLFDFMEI